MTITVNVYAVVALALASFALGCGLCNFIYGLLALKRDYRDYKASRTNK